MKTTNLSKNAPKTGFTGLKENFKSEILSGLLVSFIALPLSLGIAKASGFPPIMGVWTAIVGGLIASFFGSAPLTIKGPAAGLIVICAGAVTDMGNGILVNGVDVQGWHLAIAAVAIAGICQVLFGIFKLGKLSDFFPSSAIHGMLAAIGIIIFVKQVPILLGVAPASYKGFGPVKLLSSIPDFFAHMNGSVAIIGFVCLLIMFGMPMVKIKALKVIPPAIVALIVSVIMGITMHLTTFSPDLNSLLHVDNLFETLNFNADFSGVGSSVFIKYVIMFLLIGSIESLLTAKAMNGLDPYKRKTNYNSDLISAGIGNTVAGLFGGLPMISEIARSSANLNNGGRTMWANFFHGLFLLLFVALALPFLNMIPNAALAAILISVGYRLAAPNTFRKTYEIGAGQLFVFIGTIVMTLVEDLLVGIATGILIKIIIHIFNGVSLTSFFKSSLNVIQTDDIYTVDVTDSAIFANFLSLKKVLAKLPKGKHIIVNFKETILVDHTVLENLHSISHAYEGEGGKFEIIGLEDHKSLSNHPFATKKKK